MSFSTNKKKINRAQNNVIGNENNIINQKDINSRIDSNLRNLVPTQSLFRRIANKSTDWEQMELRDDDNISLQYKFWSIDLGNLHESIIPYISVELLYRNAQDNPNPDNFIPGNYCNYFVEIEDLDEAEFNEKIKKVKIHASLEINYGEGRIESLYEAKLLVNLINPNEFA